MPELTEQLSQALKTAIDRTETSFHFIAFLLGMLFAFLATMEWFPANTVTQDIYQSVTSNMSAACIVLAFIFLL